MSDCELLVLTRSSARTIKSLPAPQRSWATPAHGRRTRNARRSAQRVLTEFSILKAIEMPGRLLWRSTPRRQARPLPHGAEHFSVHPVLHQLELAVHAHIEIHAGRAVDGFDQVLLVHARLLQFDHLFVGKRWSAGFGRGLTRRLRPRRGLERARLTVVCFCGRLRFYIGRRGLRHRSPFQPLVMCQRRLNTALWLNEISLAGIVIN